MQAEMPRYKCHKEVWALKIGDLWLDDDEGSATMIPEDDNYGPLLLTKDYMRKHEPSIGGYYVVYKDGYTSFSPADVFEDGYTRILE